MIYITIGYKCGDSSQCDKGRTCKYRARYKFHNFSVKLHRFFEYKLHIKFPHLIYIGQKWERLSGTDKCPYRKSRNYTCYDCRFSSLADGNCYCVERANMGYEGRKPDIETKDWGKKCAYFEKCKWADDYLESK